MINLVVGAMLAVPSLGGAHAAVPADAPVVESFPYRHVTVVPGELAPGTPAPADTLWVTVDDGTATPALLHGRAVPVDGTPSVDAAHDDPGQCDRDENGPQVCWRYWQAVGDDVRIWTTFHGQSCVLTAGLAGQRTTLNCEGATITL